MDTEREIEIERDSIGGRKVKKKKKNERKSELWYNQELVLFLLHTVYALTTNTTRVKTKKYGIKREEVWSVSLKVTSDLSEFLQLNQ